MLAMFTLVVFTLVVGAITTGSFVQSANDLRAFGGGFDVRATASPAAPVRDMRAQRWPAPPGCIRPTSGSSLRSRP